MQYFGHFETLLHSRFPQLELVVRNLGWSADELTLRPRSQGFQDHGHRLEDEKPDVVIAAFGFNESFARRRRTAEVPKRSGKLHPRNDHHQIQRHRAAAIGPALADRPRKPAKAARCPTASRTTSGSTSTPQALAAAAEKNHVVFVDLFAPSGQLMAAGQRAADDQRHPSERARRRRRSPACSTRRCSARGPADTVDLEKLRAAINEKNLQFFYDYRAVNGCYIYGGRKTPFGVVNFPAEFAKLRKMIANRDQRVWAVAAGKAVPDDDRRQQHRRFRRRSKRTSRKK